MPRTGLAYAFLFLPYVLSEVFAASPMVSYGIAWLGSFFIFYLSLSGTVKPLPDDRSFARQLFRPLGLTQLTFAGYNAVTSIFYVLSLHGYYFWVHDATQAAPAREMLLAASAQRYYVLAHAAFTAGILIAMNYRSSGRWKINTSMHLPRLMLSIAVGTYALSVLLGYVPGLGQVQIRFVTLALVASVLSFALSLRSGEWGLILVNTGIYSANLVQAVLSGWKEEVIVIFLLLLMFLYPFYKRAVAIVTPAIFSILLIVLPLYVGTFRSLAWGEEQVRPEQAAQIAYSRLQQANVETIAGETWSFLTGRASEIGLFTDYLREVPENRDFYGGSIAAQAAESVIPRVLWSGKPVTERRVMQRAYENHVVSSRSDVSAKPQYIVDGYLSGGALGVFLACLLYGLLASWASRLAERWFGGYLIGSGLIYTALFRDLWTGNAFEFLSNTLFWSFMIMYALFVAGRYLDLLVPADEGAPSSATHKPVTTARA